MAKSKAKMELPTVDEMPAAGVEQVRGYDQLAEVMTQTTETTVVVREVPVESRQLAVPLADVPFGYLPRRIDLRKLTSRQSQALRQLQEALDSQGMKLANGSRIGNPANAIKWLLEAMAG
jgi:hypothetical protein